MEEKIKKVRKPRKSTTSKKRTIKKKTVNSPSIKANPVEYPEVIKDLNAHFAVMVGATYNEKQKLKKQKKYKENKNKRLKYKLVDGAFVKAKKSDKGKNVVFVTFT